MGTLKVVEQRGRWNEKDPEAFVRSEITLESLSSIFTAGDLGKQYVLKTPKAINKLGYIKEYYLCKQEKIYYRNKQNEMQNNRLDNIKNFRSKYRNGKYIDEILWERNVETNL